MYIVFSNCRLAAGLFLLVSVNRYIVAYVILGAILSVTGWLLVSLAEIYPHSMKNSSAKILGVILLSLEISGVETPSESYVECYSCFLFSVSNFFFS